MFGKALALFAMVAAVSCGVVYDSPHVGHQSEQTVRGAFGSSISHQQKAVNSAFSSVQKTDTRITNPAVYATAVHAQPAYAAAPVYSHAPVQYQSAYAAAPVAYAQQAYAAAPVQAAYATKTVSASPVYAAAPVAYAQPAVATYAAAPVVKTAYAAAPVATYAAAPVVKTAYAAAPVATYAAAPAVAKVASPSLLGVQYSAVSPAVATLNFNGYGISYGY